jgi:hypothetical protein
MRSPTPPLVDSGLEDYWTRACSQSRSITVQSLFALLTYAEPHEMFGSNGG